MFFGMHKPEEMNPEELFSMLDALFEKKLGSLGSLSNSIIKDLKHIKMEFGDQSLKLEKDDAEPYVGNIYLPNITGIKSQKNAYAKALKHAMDKMELDVQNCTNSYDRCKTILSNVDVTTNEILKLNASFKLAMFCYPRYITSFGRFFSTIEKLREALMRAIDARVHEASEYVELKGQINNLLMQIEEVKGLRESMGALKDAMDHKDQGTMEKDHEELSQKLSVKKSEFENFNHEISKLSEKINSLILPLDRSAKKLDHLSNRKKQLHPFISNPFDAIKSEGEYGQFVALVNELKEAIEAGTVDTKNKAGTLIQISTLLDSDVYGTINSVRSLRNAKLEVEREVSMLVRSINDIKESKNNSEQIKLDAMEMENSAKKLEREIALTKATIELSFSKYYRKSIRLNI